MIDSPNLRNEAFTTEYDEYSVVYDSGYLLIPGVMEAVPGGTPYEAWEAFERQFAGSSYKNTPVGMYKRHVVRQYSAPEEVEFSPEDYR